jgi:hypothetical protein
MTADVSSVSRARLDEVIASAEHAPHMQTMLAAVRDQRLCLAIIPHGCRHMREVLDEVRLPAVVIVGDDTERALGPAGFDAAATRRLFREAAYVAVMSGASVAEVYAAACRHAVDERCLVALVETRVKQEIAWASLVREANPLAALLIASPEAGRA